MGSGDAGSDTSPGAISQRPELWLLGESAFEDVVERVDVGGGTRASLALSVPAWLCSFARAARMSSSSPSRRSNARALKRCGNTKRRTGMHAAITSGKLIATDLMAAQPVSE